MRDTCQDNTLHYTTLHTRHSRQQNADVESDLDSEHAATLGREHIERHQTVGALHNTTIRYTTIYHDTRYYTRYTRYYTPHDTPIVYTTLSTKHHTHHSIHHTGHPTAILDDTNTQPSGHADTIQTTHTDRKQQQHTTETQHKSTTTRTRHERVESGE